ncbi:hypothetical protein NC651_033712 [Populus alba x Populus x berolinensis]|uniref:DUF4283 domain-containing protein n=1 Tax=Populus alba x Populus x berolinensis TaxID=444605 RepID=A0AAD6LNF1_9ROSI|nr:hypothetical protein NC651_033712 [Populus alba x Populus x berolinensis]KAJ6970260.1 hypothetical protein NC653_034753 [Populus alba x Populus x berolinensis]
MAFNRFKWVNVSGLPLAMWNKDFISNILAAQGKLIGYDLNNVGHNYISGVRVLLAISSTDSLHDRLHLALDRKKF